MIGDRVSAIELLYRLMACHMLGDYVLQSDFLATSKGTNWWHFFVHCVLYSLPFAVAFGFDWRVLALLASHVVIDAMKARLHVIDYAVDQMGHVSLLLAFYASEVR